MSFRLSRIAFGLVMAISAQNTFADNAQGVMVKFTGTSDLAVIDQRVYEFNAAAGAQFFTESVQLGMVSCLGSPSTCSPANQPPDPAPESIASVAEDLASGARCVFLDGGSLTASEQYQTSVELPGLNGVGTFTFYFDHTVEPVAAQIAPMTGWDLVSQTGNGSVNVSIGAEIAGQSVKRSKKSSHHSFRLTRNNGKSRVNNLKLRLNGNVIAKPGVTILNNCPGCAAGAPGAVDFTFVLNAGKSGKKSLLKNGDARSILNGDGDRSNNNGGRDGRLLSKGVMSPVNLQLPQGTYKLKLTGEVMGVDTTAVEGFEVDKQISVVGLGCSSN